jgi:hypothetical protein
VKGNDQVTTGRINPVVFVIIVVCLLFALYNSVSILVLGLLGETTVGTLTSYSSRLDDTSGSVNASRTVTKGYRFTVGGKEYEGHSTYKSDEAWQKLKEGERRTELISYLGFFPRVNKPTHLVDFEELGVAGVFFYLVTILGSVVLFSLLRRETGRK